MARRFSRPRMVRKRRAPGWHLVFTGALVSGAVLLLLYLQWQQRPRTVAAPVSPSPVQIDTRALADTLYARIDTVLAEVGVWPALIRKERGPHTDLIRARIPADLPLIAANLHLSRWVRRCGGRILGAAEYLHPRRVEMRCGLDSVQTTFIVLERELKLRRRSGKIAIVLDDFGQLSWHNHLIERFCALPQHLSLAILPNEGRVEAIVELARLHGHEVLVHLPMEPDDFPEKDPGPGAIFAQQNGETIRRLVREAIRKIPGAVGLNNHMGSRATANARVVEEVLREVKKHELFFLDSRTTVASIAYAAARAMGVKAAQRDVFIDGVEAQSAVERQLWELADLAARQGAAIGIGHDREETLLALEKMLPRLELRGFRFVPVSELVH